jgi:hypothetical protein
MDNESVIWEKVRTTAAPKGDRQSAPAVSVVVPVKNEAGNIAPLVAEIAAALQGRSFEIVYVNDGSNDGTEAELLGSRRNGRGCARSATINPSVSRQPYAAESLWLAHPLS